MTEDEKKETLDTRKRFLRLLKENNVLRAYINNFNAKSTYGYRDYWFGVRMGHKDRYTYNVYTILDKNRIEVLEHLLASCKQDLLINYAFVWDETPEGEKFWRNINNLWKVLHKCTPRKGRNHANYQVKKKDKVP